MPSPDLSDTNNRLEQVCTALDRVALNLRGLIDVLERTKAAPEPSDVTKEDKPKGVVDNRLSCRIVPGCPGRYEPAAPKVVAPKYLYPREIWDRYDYWKCTFCHKYDATPKSSKD